MIARSRRERRRTGGRLSGLVKQTATGAPCQFDAADGPIRREDDAHPDDAFDARATRTLGIGRLLSKTEGRRHEDFGGWSGGEHLALRCDGKRGRGRRHRRSDGRRHDWCDGKGDGDIRRDRDGKTGAKRNATLSFTRQSDGLRQ